MLKEAVFVLGLISCSSADAHPSTFVHQFRDMPVEEIAKTFGKRCLPEIVNKTRRANTIASCNCTPWSRSCSPF